MTTLIIIVHDRYDNLKHWLHCLTICPPVRTVIIHNTDTEDWSGICSQHTYIRRSNKGFDIGAMQDVFTGKIDIGEWDKLIWCCDDTFPVSTDFVQQYEEAHTTGVICMDLSPYVRPHIRTTGFMIDRDTAFKIKWNGIVTTKEHCYAFEHQDRHNTFMAQVQRMGRGVKQLAPRETSPLWDIGYHRKIDRLKEHEAIFGDIHYNQPALPDIVTFICPIYKSFPAIISSLIMQTNANWRLILIHDGPGDGSVESFVHSVNDDRVSYTETLQHKGSWGHSIRAEWLQKVQTKYVAITNPDNYYSPRFIEKAIIAIRGKVVASYPAQIIHSYTDWKVMQCRLMRGFIDCGQVMLKTKEVQAVGWKSMEHSADWVFFNDIAKRYGADKFVSFPGCHFMHN